MTGSGRRSNSLTVTRIPHTLVTCQSPELESKADLLFLERRDQGQAIRTIKWFSEIAIVDRISEYDDPPELELADVNMPDCESIKYAADVE